MIPALTLVLILQLLGEIASHSIGLPLPGPVVGLILLVAGCLIWPALAEILRPAADSLLGHLSLFFVPAGVGVIAHLPTLAQHGVGLALAVTISTVLAIGVGAAAFVGVKRMIGGVTGAEDLREAGVDHAD
ncbi:CidA/LrgA family protein [Paracoccus jeotgali]|uniref:CidA/LrgA family protein n=1 Tax=Paracoccus jeotgali TaxID=2065379 RepID=UPI0028B024B0|nr:CidA/LrgA family protein [Paracoccus jeotgali]